MEIDSSDEEEEAAADNTVSVMDPCEQSGLQSAVNRCLRSLWINFDSCCALFDFPLPLPSIHQIILGCVQLD